jgi:hypothetical protein
LSQPGAHNPKVVERAKELKIDDFSGEACPVVFWDVFGAQAHAMRRRNLLCSRRHWELSPLRFSLPSGRAAVFTIRLRLQWRRAPCAPRVANSAGKSLAGSLEESSGAVEKGDNLAVILSEAKNLRFVSCEASAKDI